MFLSHAYAAQQFLQKLITEVTLTERLRDKKNKSLRKDLFLFLSVVLILHEIRSHAKQGVERKNNALAFENRTSKSSPQSLPGDTKQYDDRLTTQLFRVLSQPYVYFVLVHKDRKHLGYTDEMGRRSLASIYTK